LVCHDTVDDYLYGSGGWFGDGYAYRGWHNDVSAILQGIKRAAGIIVGDIPHVDFNGAIGQFLDIRAGRWVNLLIVIARLLVVDAVVVEVGRSIHVDL
jgi:hypothetical protein